MLLFECTLREEVMFEICERLWQGTSTCIIRGTKSCRCVNHIVYGEFLHLFLVELIKGTRRHLCIYILSLLIHYCKFHIQLIVTKYLHKLYIN